ncbi:TetR/AcrR family transcriptional regulator [Nocardioides sp. JQ2195]|uniref:TetR/AcrR family transcriptional regulator n=1 Tax=Nocardioides sp. JQ2195 TaxID=2592334 RepID=UPI00143EF123|nr:TetR/AcrR family transcriptional regulator [Nocardioides sp. JQ2195]QIX26095.1 TetR/AcrR family transcriptional regulator [Nocardioides sp. JQ2195]
MTPAETDEASSSRPRVEGDREQEILQATLAVLCDVGYDRLTMDAVATKAKASKATLYRRWSSKSALVIDALIAEKAHPDIPDTGNLRDDLVAMSCAMGGLADQKPIGILASVLTATQRDPDFAAEFRERFLGPKAAANQVVYDRARQRGEIRDDLDIDLIAHALPGIVLQRIFLLGDQPSEELITSVIDQIIMPACRA